MFSSLKSGFTVGYLEIQIDSSKLTIDEYKSQVDEAFKDAFGNDTEEKKD